MKTTKRILVTVIAVVGSVIAHAQTDSGTTSGAEFGVKGGVNFSNLYTEDVDDNNVLTSFNAGFYAKLPITESVAIQPEFLYSRKGAELVYDNAFAQGTAKFKLNYVEVPVLLKVNILENFNIHAGPYFAYLIDAQVTNEASNANFDFEQNFENDDFNKFDAGLSAGFGFDFDNLGIGFRYNYGLTTVGKERTFGGVTYTTPDGKNSNLSLYMALKLN